jgi:hypothetical protein
VMPLKALREIVERSEYLDGGWAGGVIEMKEAAGDNAYEVEYREGRSYDLGDGANAQMIALDGQMIALDGEGPGQRMAVVNTRSNHIVVFDVESGEVVATAGSFDAGPGQLLSPFGVAFSGTGELYVSDNLLHRISVFDRQGRYVRGFGGPGEGQGQFLGLGGLCFTADGDLVVADTLNDRVQVFRQDGTFVRAIGSEGSGEGQFDQPSDVCCMPDGSIAVLDLGNCRLQVFGRDGVFLRSIGSKGGGPGQFLCPYSVAAGGGGEIIVSEKYRRNVQVFSGEGELLQIIGSNFGPVKGDTNDVDLRSVVPGVGACGDGRLFVSDGTSVVMLS